MPTLSYSLVLLRYFTVAIFILVLLVCSCSSLDTITQDRPIKDGDVLVSGRSTFALGFFSPGSSRRRYLGIWYNKVKVPQLTPIWVANRDSPLNDTSGVLFINHHGNLVLAQQNQTFNPIWSANITTTSFHNTDTSARLFETGNLVLFQQGTHKVVWQSFDYPTDTLLPFMKLGLDRQTGLNRFLTSWKSPDDPGTGTCQYMIDPTGYPQLFLLRNGAPVWRTGSWTGVRWSGVPEMTSNYIFNTSFVNNAGETTIMYGVTDDSILTRMVVNETGVVKRSTWQYSAHRWVEFWNAPEEDCDNFRKCGPNSNCDPYNAQNFRCTCLPGFEPRSPRAWYLRDGSGGCVRKAGISICRSGEGFVKMGRVKVPETSKANVDLGLSLEGCSAKCLRDCSCTGYAVANESTNSGCLTWHGDMVDTRTYVTVGQDLYIRVDAVELAKYAKKPNGSLGKKGLAAILVVSISVLLLLFIFTLYWFIRRKRQGKSLRREKYRYPFSIDSASLEDLDGRGRNPELQLFDLSQLVAATDNFSDSNKLGQGGFGPVYKGVLSDGLEIAVKILSKSSGQGIQEFRNEVSLIAKLQHRNLVRLLGYCIQKDKMLVYEYLPNKSLDYYIFDEANRSLLDWGKRLEIMCGVARGLMYLHQDSRLRIIHRDLKASNVLLDSAMIPKIADFGMAKIFGSDQIEANTNRVVGTYGYMSPEYAMDGLFSVKSDVYSFGVLVLEIITGRRNSSYYDDSPCSNLIGHVWNLWSEGRTMEIVEPSIFGEAYCPYEQVLRCIQIGLLCVQDYAADRPSMSAVVSMLGNDSTLACPKQAAFICKRGKYHSGDPSTSGGPESVNDMTVTIIDPR